MADPIWEEISTNKQLFYSQQQNDYNNEEDYNNDQSVKLVIVFSYTVRKQSQV